LNLVEFWEAKESHSGLDSLIQLGVGINLALAFFDGVRQFLFSYTVSPLNKGLDKLQRSLVFVDINGGVGQRISKQVTWWVNASQNCQNFLSHVFLFDFLKVASVCLALYLTFLLATVNYHPTEVRISCIILSATFPFVAALILFFVNLLVLFLVELYIRLYFNTKYGALIESNKELAEREITIPGTK
jgi:hypothetical protein